MSERNTTPPSDHADMNGDAWNFPSMFNMTPEDMLRMQEFWSLLSGGRQDITPLDGGGSSVTIYFPTSEFNNPYFYQPENFPRLPPGEFTITLSNGTSTNANDTLIFRLSPESLDQLQQPSAEESARLGQLADDILRSLDNLNPQQVQEMLAPAGKKAAPTRVSAPQSVQNTDEKPVKWKKTERNRLKFYRWLAENGHFDDDMRADDEDSAKVTSDVTSVSRLSDDGE